MSIGIHVNSEKFTV